MTVGQLKIYCIDEVMENMICKYINDIREIENFYKNKKHAVATFGEIGVVL